MFMLGSKVRFSLLKMSWPKICSLGSISSSSSTLPCSSVLRRVSSLSILSTFSIVLVASSLMLLASPFASRRAALLACCDVATCFCEPNCWSPLWYLARTRRNCSVVTPQSINCLAISCCVLPSSDACVIYSKIFWSVRFRPSADCAESGVIPKAETSRVRQMIMRSIFIILLNK